jgi:sucrose-6-phosphate hydrolase SacC (GH32 family)
MEYYAGAFDPELGTLAGNTSVLVDASRQFYAANLFRDADGRVLALGWVNGFPEGRGWNGWLSLTRVLTLDAEHVHRGVPRGYSDERNGIYAKLCFQACLVANRFAIFEGFAVHAPTP